MSCQNDSTVFQQIILGKTKSRPSASSTVVPSISVIHLVKGAQVLNRT